MIVDTPNKLISLTNTLNILFNTEKKRGKTFVHLLFCMTILVAFNT